MFFKKFFNNLIFKGLIFYDEQKVFQNINHTAPKVAQS